MPELGKTPAHILIIEMLQESWEKSYRGDKPVDNVYAHHTAKCEVLLEVLRRMVMPNDQIKRWVLQSLRLFAGMSFNASLSGHLEKTCKQFTAELQD